MDQILRKNDLNKINDKLIQFAFDKYFFYYDSIESYYSRKEPTLKRKVMFYLTFIMVAIFNVKYGILSLYADKEQMTLLKDGTRVMVDASKLLSAMFFSLGIVTMVGKLTIVYYEKRSNFKFFDIVVGLKMGNPIYKISKEQLNKLILKSFILYHIYAKIFGLIVVLFADFCTILATIAVHLNGDYGNVVILWISTLNILFVFHQFPILLVASYILYVPITLLNFKLDELIRKLRISIKWNNESGIHKVLKSYNELIDIVQQLSGPYNVIIGIVYCFVPYLIAVSIELVKLDKDDTILIIIEYLHWFVFIFAILTSFIINQLSASITVRNKTIPRYLYPMFFNERNLKLRTKLKIDSFIARLNQQFIGFYCFNLFKFTKLAFYQYAFSVTSTYILVFNFFKK